MNKKEIKNLALAALFLALGLVLPFVTMQIKEIGKMLLPMHLPVLLCGIICGYRYGVIVGAVLPILRSLLFSMPKMFPDAPAMMFELATYGLVIGLVYLKLSGKKGRTLLSLLAAMVAGRIVSGIAKWVLVTAAGGAYTLEMYLAGAIFDAIPGLILQIVLVPTIVFALQRAKLID